MDCRAHVTTFPIRALLKKLRCDHMQNAETTDRNIERQRGGTKCVSTGTTQRQLTCVRVIEDVATTFAGGGFRFSLPGTTVQVQNTLAWDDVRVVVLWSLGELSSWLLVASNFHMVCTCNLQTASSHSWKSRSSRAHSSERPTVVA